MSLPLEDLRTKVDLETHAALAGYAKAFDKDVSELARTILTEWATKLRMA